MEILNTFRQVRDRFAAAEGLLGLVPTMGYLHEGHVSLLEGARGGTDHVVMSMFVNPMQFNDPSDLSRYPTNRERDISLARRAGVDVVFSPDVEEMYPEPPMIQVSTGELGQRMEGVERPGHFEGVALVVAKLFAGIQPNRAYFGRKDAQQLAVVRRLAQDLSLPVDIVAMPTVREPDGVALGSRNVFLDAGDRPTARKLSQGLFAAAVAVEEGERSGPDLERIVGSTLAEHGITVEYAELASQEQAERLATLDRPAFLAAASTVGEVRLIDNIHIDWVDERPIVDRGRMLSQPSWLYDDVGNG